jgi:phosphotransferase system HPr-like phosphotransfer protein
MGGRFRMKTVSIKLGSIDQIKSFVNIIAKYDGDFDLVSGKYVVDAKSIMGIFSLDVSKELELRIHDENNVDKILEDLEAYIIKN